MYAIYKITFNANCPEYYYCFYVSNALFTIILPVIENADVFYSNIANCRSETYYYVVINEKCYTCHEYSFK